MTTNIQRPRKSASSRKRSRGNHPSLDGVMHADLFVPLPVDASAAGRTVLVQQLSQRLLKAGYQAVAFTHTIYGKPKDSVDRVAVALPEDGLCISTKNGTSTCAPGLTVLRRLHAVIENLSDVACFTNQSVTEDMSSLLQEYDIVSIAPRNEAVFRSVIASAAACDIVSLDYTGQRSGLPFRVRVGDIRTIVERQLILEIPYAPALLQPTWRKSWIQASAEILQSGRGKRPVVLLSSSGDRKAENVKDTAALALRMPRDVQNLATTVLGFDQKNFGASAQSTLNRAQRRRYGTNSIQEIGYGERPKPNNGLRETQTESANTAPAQKNKSVFQQEPTGKHKDEAADSEDDAGDGFISF
eukprot:scaffold4201_cov178-Amphora_coffeaeformis.AAC.7